MQSALFGVLPVQSVVFQIVVLCIPFLDLLLHVLECGKIIFKTDEELSALLPKEITTPLKDVGKNKAPVRKTTL